MPTLADELRERLKMKYMGDCKCGDCQLVPADLIARCAAALDALGVMNEALRGYKITITEQRSV